MAELTEAQKVDELIESAAPIMKRREQRIAAGPDSPWPDFDKTYTQQKLSFFGKLEFVRLISKAVDAAISNHDGSTGIRIADLIGVNSFEDIQRADVFIQAIVRLTAHAPDLIKDIYLISLNVPGHERPIVASIFDEAHDEETGQGGLSDDDGFAIMETFIAQNARVMRDFYQEKVMAIVTMVQEALAPPLDPTPVRSKRSKPSARATR